MSELYGIATVITVTLILFTVLLLPTSLNIRAKETTTLTFDFTLFALALTKSKKTGAHHSDAPPKKRKRCNLRKQGLKEFIPPTLRLLRHSRLEISDISLLGVDQLANGNILPSLLLVTVSMALSFLGSKTRKLIIDPKYFVISNENIKGMSLDITLSFFLIDLIIFLLCIAYLQLKDGVRRRYNARIFSK